MLSNFQITVREWFPDRLTVVFAPKVKTRPAVEQLAAFAAQVATVLNMPLANVPDPPVAFVHVAAFHVTSPALQVAAPVSGGGNEAAPASIEIFNCLVEVASTMLPTVTLAALAAVLEAISVTGKAMLAGTVTCACSLTFAFAVVEWLVSGRVTVCASSAVASKADAGTPQAGLRAFTAMFLRTLEIVPPDGRGQLQNRQGEGRGGRGPPRAKLRID